MDGRCIAQVGGPQSNSNRCARVHIGTKAVALPSDAATAAKVQEQLFDFIRRSVSDALAGSLAGVATMTRENVLGFVTGVYEQAFSILQSIGEAEVDSK